MYRRLSMQQAKYTSSPFMSKEESMISKVESMLHEVLKWNDTLEIPIIISLKNNALRKIIRCFFYAAKRPVALGFAGETASGKTTIANEIINGLANFAINENINNFITKINMDKELYDYLHQVPTDYFNNDELLSKAKDELEKALVE